MDYEQTHNDGHNVIRFSLVCRTRMLTEQTRRLFLWACAKSTAQFTSSLTRTTRISATGSQREMSRVIQNLSNGPISSLLQ